MGMTCPTNQGACRSPLLGLTILAVFGPTFVSSVARADLDVAFVLDTTGSMGGELREAKQRMTQLAASLREVRPNETVRFGVVAFRDRKDAYLVKVSALTASTDETQRFIAGLTANGGGDGPEDVLSGLATAIRDMAWSQGAERRVVLVGDAPPHLDYGHLDPETLIAEAREGKIVVDALGCRSLSGDGKAFFRRFAYATEGRYQHIGRVSREPGQMTASVLKNLTAKSPSQRLDPVVLTPLLASPKARGERVRQTAQALRPDDVPFRSELRSGGCELLVGAPSGLAVSGVPVLRADAAGTEADLELRLLRGPGPRQRRYRLQRCLSPFARIHLLVGGAS